jgi:hypothetical protein
MFVGWILYCFCVRNMGVGPAAVECSGLNFGKVLHPEFRVCLLGAASVSLE